MRWWSCEHCFRASLISHEVSKVEECVGKMEEEEEKRNEPGDATMLDLMSWATRANPSCVLLRDLRMVAPNTTLPSLMMVLYVRPLIGPLGV